MKLSGNYALIAALALLLTAGPVLAKDKSDCKMCQMRASEYSDSKCDQCGHKKHHDKKDKDFLKEKFFHKAHYYLKHQKELNLSDKQVKQIKELKLSTKKAIIMKKAEIETAALDIKSQLYYQDTIDTGSVNALVDKKYELKKEKAKMLVNVYAQLKSILTDEQQAKAKELKYGTYGKYQKK